MSRKGGPYAARAVMPQWALLDSTVQTANANGGDSQEEVYEMITYHDKATQTETEEEDTIEKILKAITTLCTKVDSMDNEIQKLKTNEDNLKSKASQ
ncbi:hypothetical protein MTR67_017366 [Solanum verrucosum]|uniref:Uncharacterized protein n=1 Tax=Solanum verrucosum TaxID=315347 RepID=A0AAF0QNN8_SOLVR|nr:hypothetical protein MTR67_017366 [Solanum verrucosum]